MLGRVLLTVNSMGLLFGAAIADWNETHIFNPRWPPHAKYAVTSYYIAHAVCRQISELLTTDSCRFHNAQTITLSIILGAATLFYTWRPLLPGRKSSSSLSPELARESLRTAAFTGTVYWLAGLVSALFPGSSGLDPEFGGPGFPQGKMFAIFAVLGILGWLVEY